MPVDAAERAYPAWLESTERLRDGTEIHLRPLGPEDEPLLEDLAAHMTPEDLRLRFFCGDARVEPRARVEAQPHRLRPRDGAPGREGRGRARRRALSRRGRPQP